MTGQLALALLVPATAFGLLAAVVARKAARDLVELQSASRRRRLSEGRGDDLADAVSAAVGGGIWTQADLLDVLRQADPQQHEALVRAADGAETDRVLSRGLTARRAAVRGRAILLSAWLRRPVALAAATAGLADRDADVRMASCAALGALASAGAAHALLDAIEEGAAPIPRLVERLAEPWAVPTLCAALSTASPGTTRAACLRAIGLAGQQSAAQHLVPFVTSLDPEDRTSAVRALGQLRSPATVDVVALALTDPHWEVRAQAARALAELGDPGAVAALERATTDQAWWVRANASHALARLGPPGIDALRRARDGSDPYAADRADEELHLLEAAA